MKTVKLLGCVSGLMLLAACQSIFAKKPDSSVESTLTPVAEIKPATEAEAKAKQNKKVKKIP